MIGDIIRSIRKEKKMTANQLAEQCGLTPSYISQLERNLLDPSISSLRKISSILDVPIYTFLAEDLELDKKNLFMKKNDRRKLKLANSNITYEFLTPLIRSKDVNVKMNIIEYNLNKKSYDSYDYLVHNADECIFVTKGKLDVFVENDVYHLDEGDSVYILANTPHRVYNPTDDDTMGYSCITPSIY